jgi:hypothetical protein
MPAGKQLREVDLRMQSFDMRVLPPVVLSTAYLPSVEYMAMWMHAPATYLEQYEYFEKQSYRNRCRIASSTGAMELSIPVERPSGNRTLIRDVRLSDHGNWAQQHWKAIESSYQSSAFFEYFADELKAIYDNPAECLWDFNRQLMELLASWLEIDKPLLTTEAFGAVPDDALVLRQLLHPKKPGIVARLPVYYQVFASKSGFIPNLSVLDLVMNCGNEAILYLDSFKNDKFSVIL